MARHFTWCLKRTFLLSNRLKVYQQPVPLLKANGYAIQSRNIADPRANPINVDFDEPKDFDEFAEEFKHSQSVAIITLMKILSITRANATKAVDEYPNFKDLPKKIILRNFQTLREGGFYKSTIKDNKYLLTDDSDTLKKKMNIIRQIDIDINDAAPLFQLSVVQLVNFARRSKIDASYLPARNRLVYLSEKLDVDVARICNVLSYNPLLLKLPAPKLLSITEYILEAGMEPEHVLDDVQVYNYNIGTIKSKIERAKRAGVKPLRPWVLRCQESVWKKIEERHCEEESILEPGQTVTDFLRDTFDCDIESVNFVIAKDPKLLTMELRKLANIARFLHGEGFKIGDIQRCPAVMHRNYANLQERMSEWKKLCKRSPPLYVFSLTDEKFNQALEIERSHNGIEKSS